MKTLLVRAEYFLADGQTDGHAEAYSLWIWHSENRASWFILIIKAIEVHYFSPFFDKELYMLQTDLLSIIRSLNTVYTATGICDASYVDCLLATASRQST